MTQPLRESALASAPRTLRSQTPVVFYHVNTCGPAMHTVKIDRH